MELSKSLVTKCLNVIDVGLVRGIGSPVPGQMCVEAAICYALDLPHSDDPQCVAQSVRTLKIKLNDAEWSNNEARAKGLRRLAIAQLNTATGFDETEFAIRVALICYAEPSFVSWAQDWLSGSNRNESAARSAAESAALPTAQSAARSAARSAALPTALPTAQSAAWSAAWSAAESAAWSAAWSAAESRDKVLSDFAESVVQVLVTMKAPGTEYLSLTE